MGAIAQKRGVNVIAFGAIEDADLEENAYDVIYLNGSSSYMDDLHKAFAVCKKALKPGGASSRWMCPKRVLSALCICWLRIWAPLTILI